MRDEIYGYNELRGCCQKCGKTRCQRWQFQPTVPPSMQDDGMVTTLAVAKTSGYLCPEHARQWKEECAKHQTGNPAVDKILYSVWRMEHGK